jgi:hypothetical protein
VNRLTFARREAARLGGHVRWRGPVGAHPPSYTLDVQPGTVDAHSCFLYTLGHVDAGPSDYMVLNPDVLTSQDNLSYTIEYYVSTTYPYLKICNPTATAINDGQNTVNFPLLVIGG